ncbi:hypothetical protein DFJ73DRAFT_237247 [Zopfochytrium polystomum]|nr:hypothetical protein DFJ73DRAFT_237247 [Zopfochytrium polystomum]
MNFRKAYYSSLGVQIVEAKPTVENALLGDNLDVGKLNKVCLWVRIPHVYRSAVWKVILGVLPTTTNVWKYAIQQREEQFHSLKEAAQLIFETSINGNGKEFTPERMVQMLLLEADVPRPHRIGEMKRILLHSSHLLSIADCLLDVCDNMEIDAFWIFAKLIQNRKVVMAPPTMTPLQKEALNQQHAQLFVMLKTECPTVLAAIESTNANLVQLTTPWFLSLFACVLPSHCLEGIWDVYLGGAPDVLPYVALSLLLAVRWKLESARSIDEIADYVNVDAVAATAIEIWEKPVLEAMPDAARRSLVLA